MGVNSLCRIGVFYDGSYFAYAQRFFYREHELGWLEFRPFQALVERFVAERETSFAYHKVVYSAWFQGLYHSSKPSEGQLRFDRRLLDDLMYAGIEPKYQPKPESGEEKGVDVSLTIDALQVGMGGKIDVAVLVTGDRDLVPLAQALMADGVRVGVVYFAYKGRESESRVSGNLVAACNYALDFNQLEHDETYQADFKEVFFKQG